MKYHIVDVNTSTQLKNQLIKYAKNCSFQGTGSYLAELLFYNECEDYEKIFAVVSDNQVIGFAALLKKYFYVLFRIKTFMRKLGF